MNAVSPLNSSEERCIKKQSVITIIKSSKFAKAIHHFKAFIPLFSSGELLSLQPNAKQNIKNMYG